MSAGKMLLTGNYCVHKDFKKLEGTLLVV